LVWNVKWHLSINDIEELVLVPMKPFVTLYFSHSCEKQSGQGYIISIYLLPLTTLALLMNIPLVTWWGLLMPIQKFKRIMRAIQGALIVASTLQIVLGFSGLWRNVTRLVRNLNWCLYFGSACTLLSIAFDDKQI
jgi:hypothetical protein